jgi:hypothetical protein
VPLWVLRRQGIEGDLLSVQIEPTCSSGTSLLVLGHWTGDMVVCARAEEVLTHGLFGVTLAPARRERYG